MKFIIDKKIKSTIPSTKLYDLGTDAKIGINNLLDLSTINIDQNIIPILKINDSNYLINDWNSKNIKESVELLLTEDDLINLGGSGSGGGDYIPLAGTEVDSPVTGDIHSISNFFIDYDNGDPFVSILPVDRIICLGDAIDNYNSTQIGINDVQQKVTINAFLGTRVSSGENLVLEIFSESPTSRGIVGLQDFTSNITDLDFTQKIYVDTYTQRTTATSGTVNIDSGRRDLVLIHEAGATTSLKLNLPTSPKNNQKVTIMSVGGIVGLTLVTAVGTIVGAVTTLAALGTTKLIWNSSQSKWYKIS